MLGGFQGQSESKGDPQTRPVVELKEIRNSHYENTVSAETVFNQVRPPFDKFTKVDMPACPILESAGNLHDHAHEFIGPVEDFTRSPFGIRRIPLVAGLPKGHRPRENRGSVGMFGQITHHFTGTLRSDSFLE